MREQTGGAENLGARESAIDLAPLIDHTLLRPDAGENDVRKLCAEARTHHLHSVCINPVYVALAARELAGTGVAISAVVGFPLGASLGAIKAAEAQAALADGARELDMVLDLGALKDGYFAQVSADIARVRRAAEGAVLKVILETGLLTEGEKTLAAELALGAGADFVKTSTGFLGTGATVADVALLRRVVGSDAGVKASGGIRTRDQALALVAAGASRLGTSASLTLIGAAG
jgi:deoxyribose-phosphate aldolase